MTVQVSVSRTSQSIECDQRKCLKTLAKEHGYKVSDGIAGMYLSRGIIGLFGKVIIWGSHTKSPTIHSSYHKPPKELISFCREMVGKRIVNSVLLKSGKDYKFDYEYKFELGCSAK